MTDTKIHENERPFWPSVWAGFRRSCPNCGEGAMFQGYLRATDACGTCGQEYHAHHRADDGPAYIVILFVAHVLGLLFHLLFEVLNRDPVLLISVLIPVSVGMCLLLLPRVKGALIALQWAKQMHGFSADPTSDQGLGHADRTV